MYREIEALEFDRRPRREPEKLVELSGMKYLTIRVNNVDLPFSFSRSPALRHSNDRAGIERSLALVAFF